VKLTPAQREQVRMMFGGKCAYCGCELPEKGWHADHVEPIYREWWKTQKWWRDSHAFKTEYVEDADGNGRIVRTPVEIGPIGMEHPENDTIGNLMPACRACNIDKSAMKLETWRGLLRDRVNVCRRNYSAFRHAERFGLVVEVKKPVVFWFERYQEEAQTR
jgi:hypothetical protein